VTTSLTQGGYFESTSEIIRRSNRQIQIIIHKGPQIHIASVHIEIKGEGAKHNQLVALVKGTPIHIGDPLRTEQYKKFKLKLINTAENLGYLHTSFTKAEILVDTKKQIAQIEIIFNTGPLYYFGQVQFEPTNISPELLHRFVPFRPGQFYSTTKVLNFNNALSDSGYFSSVLIQPMITEDQIIPVEVHLKPTSKYSYSLGVGYGTDTGIRGRAGLHVVPVNRFGHKFNALAQGSLIQNAIQAQYVIPGQNPVTDQYSLTGNFSTLNYTIGYGNAFLISLAQQHNTDFFNRSLSINALYEGFNYALQPNTSQSMLYPKATISFIRKENPLFSPTGFNITINGLGANQLTLSTINFAQTSIDVKAAYWIETWRLRLYGHTIQGITATNDINRLPLSLALLLGGNDNLKGYSFNSIGPGRIISYGGFEIQKETKPNWYLVGLFDAGDVFNPTVKQTQYDVGAALMWVSPIGPIKIGFAQPVSNHMKRLSTYPRLLITMGPSL
jgi:translocation and assembly module TamA